MKQERLIVVVPKESTKEFTIIEYSPSALPKTPIIPPDPVAIEE